MLPLLKILTVIFKVFSKPLINYTKKHHVARNKEQKHPTLSKRFFVWFGNHVNVFESKVNRKFLNISSDIPFKIKILKEEDALEKGLEYFYEIIFYAFLIALPLHEMYKANKDGKVKSEELSKRLKQIEQNIKETKHYFVEESHSINGQIGEIQVKINEKDQSLLDLANLYQERRKKNDEEIKKTFTRSKIIIDDLVKVQKQMNEALKKINKQQEQIRLLTSPTSLD